MKLGKIKYDKINHFFLNISRDTLENVTKKKYWIQESKEY